MKSKFRFDLKEFAIDHINTIVFTVLVLGLVGYVSGRNPLFLANIQTDLLKRFGAYVLMAVGVGGILMTGGVDLSSGRIMGLCALVSAAFMQTIDAQTKIFPNQAPTTLGNALAIALLIGAVIGIIHWLITSGLNASCFIVTLASQILIYGIMLVFLGKGTNMGQNISHLSHEYSMFVAGEGFVPSYVVYSIGIVLVLWLIYALTPLGRNMRAIGTDRAAAKASGINVFLITSIPFVIAGMLYGFSGFVEAARIGGPGASAGVNAELDAIIACLLGGLSVKGGVGGIGGIIIGVILLQLISICLQWISVSANYVYIIKGLVLCVAIILDMVRWKIKEK